jgi:hypothetical protein
MRVVLRLAQHAHPSTVHVVAPVFQASTLATLDAIALLADTGVLQDFAGFLRNEYHPLHLPLLSRLLTRRRIVTSVVARHLDNLRHC